ncbi:uncharacterized protein LOC142224950 [Haematobia irritans]|uniref:uncharacterized protein LOC142224950 n=1 Tax=Haematobia irritans TaxID=7368 RepID=UPI003F4F76BD
MEDILDKEFYISNVKQVIDDVIHNCIPCILADKKCGRKEGFLNPIPKGSVSLDTWHIDHLGPMHSTHKNYKHILTIIDVFTKFVWIFQTKSTTTVEVIEKMKIITTTFGNPRRIITDKGIAFTS